LDIEKLYNARLLKMSDLMIVSDVISIHTPLLPETHHLIGLEELRLMKPTAILVNTARGPVVDEKALIRVLQLNEIYGAGLDVYEFEPLINPELFLLDNVVLAPHIGTATVESRVEMNQFVSQNIIGFFEGRVDITRVN
jgi:lactate dehydrogenase-like 2-hydroxyacid dehydrogenase